MDIDRTRVVVIIRAIRDAILADRTTGIPRPPDPRDSELVRRACAEHGMTVDEWTAALDADPDLARLFDEVLAELVAPPDPGPYDTISRESPSGSPDADRDAFERDARLLDPTHR